MLCNTWVCVAAATPAWYGVGKFYSLPTLRSTVQGYTEWCKINPACLNFRGLAPASLSNQPKPTKSAIFAKIGRKTINLAGLFLHNGVHFRRPAFSHSPLICSYFWPMMCVLFSSALPLFLDQIHLWSLFFCTGRGICSRTWVGFILTVPPPCPAAMQIHSVWPWV